jgi:uncharacterized membrane protein YcgQ (UPF0703/DUF1980 family)
MKAYQDQPAEMEGRLIDEDDELNPGGNRKRLYRVFMTCCAADAQVLGIALEFDGPLPDFPDKTWVRVTGRVRFEKVGKQDYAYLSGCEVEPATAPDPKEQYRRKY